MLYEVELKNSTTGLWEQRLVSYDSSDELLVAANEICQGPKYCEWRLKLPDSGFFDDCDWGCW